MRALNLVALLVNLKVERAGPTPQAIIKRASSHPLTKVIRVRCVVVAAKDANPAKLRC